MENLISLVNIIQRACTALGDHGEGSTLPTLWDSLPVIAVVGGQMEMAISATAPGIANIADGKMGSSMGNLNSNLLNFISPFKRMKKVLSEGSSSSHGITTAIGLRRVGSPQMLLDAVLAPKSLMPLKRRM
ncbi:hypothetical protein L484_015559 [Morus notabilis]|uniref:Uncharacterized protein n=1 Tax=Morus notabilis TaxID=981085 RepID=W9SIV7_9ROSA|nr:hypothetical protein L484_015559 [Morus notabilis]